MVKNSFINNFILSKKHSIGENAFLCIAATLTPAFLSYDSYHGFLDLLKPFLAVLIFLVWAWCAFSSGKDKKPLFLVFAGVYWIVPYIYMLFYSARDNVAHYSKVLSFLNKSADVLFNRPFKLLTDYAGCEAGIFIICLIGLVIFSYLVGYNISDTYKEQISDDELDEVSDNVSEDDSGKYERYKTVTFNLNADSEISSEDENDNIIQDNKETMSEEDFLNSILTEYNKDNQNAK